MLFNSLEFSIFLPIVFLIYWNLNKYLRVQNFFILVVSYIFYGWWNWKFLILIFISSLVDYLVGLGLLKFDRKKQRKKLLLVSIFTNLGLLGFFKYYNFFVNSFVDAFSLFGFSPNIQTINIILPVGISFYTFQTMSYTIDCYRKKLEPTKDIVSFFAYVSFFPQLVAGPIERAINLLPQFQKQRVFNYDLATDGTRQILWGLFKKVVVADNCNVFVTQVFDSPNSFPSSSLLFACILFAFQIYCDFSGYSDIAIGTAKMFGFKLMPNFAYPFFSRNLNEFWQRWHISLSSWIRDYIYISLGGNINRIRNFTVTFVLMGFWHGANWTFIAWGLLQSAYYLPFLVLKKAYNYKDIVAKGKLLPNLKEAYQMLVIFMLFAISAVFFRANDINNSFEFIKALVSTSLFSFPKGLPKNTLVFILVLIIFEWFSREKEHPLFFKGYKIKNTIVCSFVFLIILFFANYDNNSFIYFQF